MEARVLKPFYDLKESADRRAGDTFEATEERIAEINAVLGEPYVEAAPATAGAAVEKPAKKAPARKPAAKRG